MRHICMVSVAHGLALVAKTAAAIVSYNSQCGLPSNFTCVGSLYGDCCAANGFCGSTEKHCGVGCQADYGVCPGKQQLELKIRGYGRCQHGWTPTGVVYEELTSLPTTTAPLEYTHVTPSLTVISSEEADITASDSVPSRLPTDVATNDAQPTDGEPTDEVEPTPITSEPTPSPSILSPSGTGQSICQDSGNECIDNFLIGCGRIIQVKPVPSCENILVNSDKDCQEACLDDDDCTGWNGYLMAGDIEAGIISDFFCCHFHDPLVLDPTATPRPEYGNDWGIRNAC
ncbi:hypothetical protein PFICI_12498 [Pestalotiopsis fici W106-1]|uniref:Chitin-binding type-1 domain-containing protein n=1 Tax=Pestalotiopsis fici (strain W106-1 / CGMCC3.15140) TaxID=1229662 RepID=W3WP27_PESFW|nr:uncharacterized protein PFICI_12498 [Pestalotiopsis fici W106-1]ETS75554.1 hypothetical protein PFICI_12498 [Pestalotiopsis fici W106-1]